MKQLTLLGFLAGIFLSFSVSAQNGSFHFREQLKESPSEKIAFAVDNTAGLLEKLLAQKEILVKSVTPQFIYIQASAAWMNDAKNSGLIPSIHFEFAPPASLADTARAKHFVDQVHNGEFGLQVPFTGKDVVIGYVDNGLDYTHPDFIDENGQTRVLYYWDHTAGSGPSTPAEYGYGQVCTGAEIQAGTCGSTEEATAHGTTVAGMGSGNGRANGQNKGIAPDSKIIVVETNFNLPNWTLTIADACDFIFAKAAELGLPAVVNLSVGTYLGSHDGNDPASELMEQLIDAAPGRIIVSAAGNSGLQGKYHVHNDIPADTSFVWLRNNPSGPVGPNSAYFDLWSDQPEATWSYAFAANLNSGTFEKRAVTSFRPAVFSAGTPFRDTLWNGTNRIATLEIYPEIVGGNFHMEAVFSHVDSTNYNLSFLTTGTGSYDLWSGAFQGLNTIVTNTPSPAVCPAIVHYVQPDSLQTIVSSWNCSEKVISVGNVRNRFGHWDNDGNYWQPDPSSPPVGALSGNSSKGPNRHNVIKPDISAGGDGSLSAGPLWLITNPVYNALIDSGGFHVRNGGTSMASPVVAGIAALYLEKCSRGTNETFKEHMFTSAITDAYTGAVPNNAYGYGKIHALNLMLESNYAVAITGPEQLCAENDTASAVSCTLDYTWNTGTTGCFEVVAASGDYWFVSQDALGCVFYSDTLTITQGDLPAQPVITLTGSTLVTAPYPLLQWYEDGIAIPGAVGNTISVSLPITSDYTVEAAGMSGCTVSSDIYNEFTGLNDLSAGNFSVYPNPASETLTVSGNPAINSWIIFDVNGRQISDGGQLPGSEINIEKLTSGTYFIEISTAETVGRLKFVKI